tara:strand:+ start:341 stop:715 length:375 start_codon:yes stop_codon:yes gene_type:complete
VPVGSIVKTLIFIVKSEDKNTPIVTLVAGDKKCNIGLIPGILNLKGVTVRPDAKTVKNITGYSIGGVSPLGLPDKLNIVIDTSLKRFDKVWSAAGHTHCVFGASYSELVNMTGAEESDQIAINL